MNVFMRAPLHYDEAVDVLGRMRREGVTHVNFTGGEPTIFPRFPDLVAHARTLGMRVYMATNGVLTARRPFAAKVVPLLDELSFSIHGHTARVHDAMTLMPGSFANLTATMKAAVEVRAHGKRPRLFMNMVVNRGNVESVAPLLRLAARLGVEQFLLSNLSSEGAGRDFYTDLVLPLSAWRERAPAWVEAAAVLDVPLRFFALPFCVLGPGLHLANDHFFDPRVTVERIHLPDGRAALTKVVSQHSGRGRTRTPRCEGCVHFSACGGPVARYVEEYGDAELQAVTRAAG